MDAQPDLFERVKDEVVLDAMASLLGSADGKDISPPDAGRLQLFLLKAVDDAADRDPEPRDTWGPLQTLDTAERAVKAALEEWTTRREKHLTEFAEPALLAAMDRLNRRMEWLSRSQQVPNPLPEEFMSEARSNLLETLGKLSPQASPDVLTRTAERMAWDLFRTTWG